MNNNSKKCRALIIFKTVTPLLKTVSELIKETTHSRLVLQKVRRNPVFSRAKNWSFTVYFGYGFLPLKRSKSISRSNDMVVRH